MTNAEQSESRNDRFVGDADEMIVRKPSKWGTVYDSKTFKRIRTATAQDARAVAERGQIDLSDGSVGIIR